jgi:hypothetical protein
LYAVQAEGMMPVMIKRLVQRILRFDPKPLALLAFMLLLLTNSAVLQAQDSLTKATQDLFKGAETNNLELVKRAIHRGANILARNSLGQRAHDVAVDLNYIDIAHYILSMRPRQPTPRPAVVVTVPPPVLPATPIQPAPVAAKPVVRQKPVENKPVVAAISASKSREISEHIQTSQPKPLKPITLKSQLLKPVTRKSQQITKAPTPVKPVAVAVVAPVAAPVAAPVVVARPSPAIKPANTVKTPKIAVVSPASVVPGTTNPKASGVFNFFGNRIGWPVTEGTRCLTKPGDIQVCLQPLKWPADLKKWFDVDTVYYDGPKSLVMYQGGQLRQLHVLFERAGYGDINNFLNRQLAGAGQASLLKRHENTQDYLGSSHRIATWRGLKGSWPDSMEIRELDSLRWSSLPDEQHGMIRVFRAGEDPVFKHVSSADFMLGFLTSGAKKKQ